MSASLEASWSSGILASGPGYLALCCPRSANNSACMSLISRSCLSSLRESLPSVLYIYGQSLEALPSQPAAFESESHVPGAVSKYEYPAAIAVSDVPGSESRMHTHYHDRSEAHDELFDSILSSKPKPLGKYRPPPSQSILSPG
ncbi:hypothetical protein Tco_0350771, partial [Tanacetum coccineum]